MIQTAVARAIGHNGTLPHRSHDVHIRCPRFNFEDGLDALLTHDFVEGTGEGGGTAVSERQLMSIKIIYTFEVIDNKRLEDHKHTAFLSG